MRHVSEHFWSEKLSKQGVGQTRTIDSDTSVRSWKELEESSTLR